MKTLEIRRVLDVAIGLVVLLGVLYYLPKLSHAVKQLVEKAAGDADWQPGYARAFFLLGLVPLVGSILMLVPCLSCLRPPLRPSSRVFLGLCCMAPLAMAAWGAVLGPPGFWGSYLSVGLLFSLGVWLFALPPALRNVSTLDLPASLLARIRSRAPARPPRKQPVQR